ncbi:MAG: ABC transporter ATP-binding protein [Rhodobacteraceae bacterium]|nr:ABC transporter ATP-binding protein [Paracoccaceae bacterium]
MTPILEIAGLGAGYGSVPILHGINLSFGAGQVCGLVGPNGHGKTTLLRTISGLLPTTRGQTTFDGESITGLPVHEIVGRGVIHVPQGDMLFGEMSVLDNLLVAGTRLAATSEVEDRLAVVFDLLPRLKERRFQSAFTLSGGERRMVAIGRGLMAGGRLLMLDEPSLGLAPAVIDEIYDVISKLSHAGQSVLVVEENVTRAAEVSDVVALMDHGQIVQVGAPETLLSGLSIDATYFGG